MGLNRQLFRKIMLVSGIVFLFILVFFLFLHYLRQKKGLLDFRISRGYINLSRIDYKFFKKGVLTYEIFADKLNYQSENKNAIRLRDVKAYIYGKEKKIDYVITGKSGILNTKSKDVKVSGGVVIKYSGGTDLTANTMNYEAKKDSINIPGRVEIKGKNYFISGIGLIFSIKRNVFLLQKNVHFISDINEAGKRAKG